MIIKMTERASNQIKTLAKKRGKNISDLLNEALGLEEIAIQAMENGGKMLIQDKKGDIYPIKFQGQKNEEYKKNWV